MQFLKSFLANSDGTGSSKRLIAFGCFLLFAELVNVSTFTGKPIDPISLSAIIAVIFGAMGMSTNENKAEIKADNK